MSIQKGNLSKEFLSGFRYELGNRAFALIAVGKVSQRMAGTRQDLFWGSYHALEKFNQPKYEKAAQMLGIEISIGSGPKLKGHLVGATPKFMLGALIRYVYPQTITYLKKLKKLQAIGPAAAQPFLAYMVAQEELQIEMMRLAIAQKYEEIPALLKKNLQNYTI